MQKQSKTTTFTKRLTESGIMIALTFVLSYFKLLDLPYGGSITLCSMLPTIIIAYRHGIVWGLGTGFVNGVLQLLMGMSALSYATSPTAAVAIILLDYILAFSVTGFGGIFRKKVKNQTLAIIFGAGSVCLMRYAFHVISGCTVWAGLSIPTEAALIYSLAYNATYMLPELIITVIGAAYLSNAIGFEGEMFTRISKNQNPKGLMALKSIGLLGFLGALIGEVVIIAPHLQNAETGDFDITGLANVNLTLIFIIAAIGLAWLVIFNLIYRFKAKK